MLHGIWDDHPPTHTHTRHMFLGNVNECVTKKAMKTLNTIRPCATMMSYTAFVLVCVHVGVCACTTKGRQAHVGAESYINHTQNQLESINVRRPTAVGVLVLGLMLAWLQTHHTLTIPPRARTHTHTHLDLKPDTNTQRVWVWLWCNW